MNSESLYDAREKTDFSSEEKCTFCHGGKSETCKLIHEEHANGSGVCRQDICMSCLREFMAVENKNAVNVARGSWETELSKLFQCGLCRALYSGNVGCELASMVYEQRIHEYALESFLFIFQFLYLLYVDYPFCSLIYHLLLHQNGVLMSAIVSASVTYDAFGQAVGAAACILFSSVVWFILCARFFHIRDDSRGRSLRCMLEALSDSVMYGQRRILRRDARFSLVYVVLLCRIIVFCWSRLTLLRVMYHALDRDGSYIYAALSFVFAFYFANKM